MMKTTAFTLLIIPLLTAMSTASALSAVLPSLKTETGRVGDKPSTDEKRLAAEEEIYQGACAYEAKNYAEAERRFAKALAINPEDKRLPLYLARSLHAQATNRTTTVKDPEKAHAAIKAYEGVLTKDVEKADQDEAVAAILRLYEQLNQAEQARAWLLKWADSKALSMRLQAQLFTLLANRHWDAAYKITHGTSLELLKSVGANELSRARQDVQQGLEAVEKALQLNSDSLDAWWNQYLLLTVKAEIAGLENRSDEQALNKKAAAEAKAKYEAKQAARRADSRAAGSKPEASKDKTASTDQEFELLKALEAFRTSGKFKRRGDPDALISPVEDNVGLIPPPPPPPPPPDVTTGRKASSPTPEPFDPEKAAKQREEELRARRLAKRPWKRISPIGEGFSVLMPSPVEKAYDGNYQVSAEGVDYFLNRRSLDRPAPAQPKDELIITTIALGAAQGICGMPSYGGTSCEVAFVKDLAIAGGTGRQYSVTYSKCGAVETGVLQVFISQRDSYVVWAMGAGGSDPRVAKFLQSFTLDKPVKAR